MTVANTTLEAGTAQGEAPAQSAETDAQPQAEGQGAPAQPAKDAGSGDASKAETLRKLLQREKDNPETKFTDAELDILDLYYAGKLKPSKKTKPGNQPVEKPEAAEAPDPEAEGKQAPEEEEEDKEPAPNEDEDPEEEADKAPDPDAEALMKEVGAKSLKDALAKVKELRSKLGGKDAQAVARLTSDNQALTKAIRNERAFMADLKAGKPEAIAHLEKAYGLKLATAGSPAQPAPGAQAKPAGAPADGKTWIPRDKFIDEESADLVNNAFGQLYQEIEGLKTTAKDFQDERTRTRQSAAEASARSAAVDEMLQVAEGIPSLAGIKNLRASLDAWYNQGKDDSRLEVFQELFDISEKEGCSLSAAALIKRGKDAGKAIETAKEEGRNAAYQHKPNPSLSGIQGGRGETTYTRLTERQIDAMEADHKLMPPDWFDAEDNPVKSKIPKAAWRLFGFT